MPSELIFFLLRSNLVLSAAVLLILSVRKPIRALFGAPNAYALWLIAPLATLALLIPAPAVQPLESVRLVEIARGSVTAVAAVHASVKAVGEIAPLSHVPVGPLLLGLWIAVALLGLLIQAERQRRFVDSLGKLSVWNGLLWSDRRGVGPALVGALVPRIVLPADFSTRFTRAEQALILAHERHHLAMGDARINAAVTVLQCLFWFNPFLHLGAAVLRLDQEIACDAAILAGHPGTRRTYGEAMLKTQLAPFGPPLGCHWPASASRQLKARFTLLACHRPDRRRTLSGAVAVAILSVSASAAAWATQPPQIVREVADTAERTARRVFVDPLLAAVEARDIAAVRRLIAGGVDVNAIHPGDGAPLIAAARDGQREIVQLLLTAGADPNLAVRGDGAPLIQAAASGSLDTVRLLVAHGADVELFVPDDETPLIRAAQAGDLAIVTYLVARGADVTRAVPANPGRMRSPLGEARRYGHTAVATYLVTMGA